MNYPYISAFDLGVGVIRESPLHLARWIGEFA